jgi:hypothetical protein
LSKTDFSDPWTWAFEYDFQFLAIRHRIRLQNAYDHINNLPHDTIEALKSWTWIKFKAFNSTMHCTALHSIFKYAASDQWNDDLFDISRRNINKRLKQMADMNHQWSDRIFIQWDPLFNQRSRELKDDQSQSIRWC